MVDIDGFVNQLKTFDAVVESGFAIAAIDIAVDNLPEDIIYKTALARSADTCDADESSEGKFSGDIFEIIVAGVVDDDAATVGGTTSFGNVDGLAAGKKLSGDAAG